MIVPGVDNPSPPNLTEAALGTVIVPGVHNPSPPNLTEAALGTVIVPRVHNPAVIQGTAASTAPPEGQFLSWLIVMPATSKKRASHCEKVSEGSSYRNKK